MNDIDPKDVVLGLLLFIVLSYLFKIVLLTSFANLIIGVFVEDAHSALYIAIVGTILVTGLAVGRFLNTRNASGAFLHAIVIGALAGIYKALRPDLNPMPVLLIMVLALLNFAAVVWGTHVTARK